MEQYRYEEDMLLPSYQALRHRLLEFSEKTGVLYAYYIRPHGNRLYYIIDNDFDEETRVGLDTPHFYADEIPWILPVLEGQSVCSGLGNYTPDWEGLLSAFVLPWVEASAWKVGMAKGALSQLSFLKVLNLRSCFQKQKIRRVRLI